VGRGVVGLLDATVIAIALDAHGGVRVAGVELLGLGVRVGVLVVLGLLAVGLEDDASPPAGRLVGRLVGLVLVAGRGLRGGRVGLRDVTAVPVALDAHGGVGVARALLGRVGGRLGLLVVGRPLADVLDDEPAVPVAAAVLARRLLDGSGARVLGRVLVGVVLVARRRVGRGVVGLLDVTVVAVALDANRRVLVARARLARG